MHDTDIQTVPIGACLDIIVVLWWERYLERAKARNAPWAFNEEYRRMPLACIGGPLCALSLFWLVRQASPRIQKFSQANLEPTKP